MPKPDERLAVPEIPEEISVQGFLDMSQWIINTCAMVRCQGGPIQRFCWYEPSEQAPFWIAVGNVDIIPKRKRIRPPLVTVNIAQAFIREDGTEFDMTAERDMEAKAQLEFEEDPFNVDGYKIMRDYCLATHKPVAQRKRVLTYTDLSTLENSGPFPS